MGAPSILSSNALRLPVLLLVLSAVWLTACQPATGQADGLGNQSLADSGAPSLFPTLAPASVALGAAVYAAQCASCHGVDLAGESEWKAQNEDGSFRAPPHDASGHTWHHGDEMLLEAIRLGGARFDGLNIGGTSNMPAFAGTLAQGEITAVLAFIKSTWPEDVRALQWEATLREAEQAGGG